MNYYDEFFQRKTLNVDKCLNYGFLRKDTSYIYTFFILNGDFKVFLEVLENGKVFLKVTDTYQEDEFLPISMKKRGAYAATVYKALKEKLQDITAVCFSSEPFLKPQSNRITSLIYSKFSEGPDFPFVKLPTYGVFRAPNKKWYALIMDLEKSRFIEHVIKTLSENNLKSVKSSKSSSIAKHESENRVEIVNLKICPTRKGELLSHNGIYCCYHMNHDNWISVLLDDSLDDDFLLSLIEESRELVLSEKPKSSRRKSPKNSV